MSERCYIGTRLADESHEHDADCAQCRPAADPPTIVGEVSKTWREDRETLVDGPILAQRFEAMVEHNRARGYTLHSWQMTSTWVSPGVLTETIVAVFTRGDR